jgi:hypothetical protein
VQNEELLTFLKIDLIVILVRFLEGPVVLEHAGELPKLSKLLDSIFLHFNIFGVLKLLQNDCR